MNSVISTASTPASITATIESKKDLDEEKRTKPSSSSFNEDDDEDEEEAVVLYVNLGAEKQLSLTMTEITNMKKRNDLLVSENELLEQREEERAMEMTSYADELVAKIEQLREELMKEKEQRSEDVYKIEQEKAEVIEANVDLKVALRNYEDSVEKAEDSLRKSNTENEKLAKEIERLKRESDTVLKNETIKAERVLTEKMDEQKALVENIKWEMDTKINALALDKEDLIKTYEDSLKKQNKKLEEHKEAILRITLERDSQTELLKKEKEGLEKDLKEQNLAISALSERLKSEEDVQKKLSIAETRAKTLEKAMEHLEEALQDDLIESELRTTRAKKMLALAEEKSDHLEKRVQYLLDELESYDSSSLQQLLTTADSSFSSSRTEDDNNDNNTYIAKIRELEEELEEVGDLDEIRNAIMNECSLMREEVELMENKIEKLRIERDIANARLSKYE